MADIPIIFSGPMVKALLEGRKTMTRRLAWADDGKEMSWEDGERLEAKGYRLDELGTTSCVVYRPSPWQRVNLGDWLWVKEDLRCFNRATAQYVADITPVAAVDPVDRAIDGRAKWQWKTKYLTGRFCPRWASRLTLTVTATKIERLQDISEPDAKAEGAIFHDGHGVGHSGWRHDLEHGYVHANAKTSFACLWDRLHGEGSFNDCQEVVALTFQVHKQNIDSLPAVALAA